MAPENSEYASIAQRFAAARAKAQEHTPKTKKAPDAGDQQAAAATAAFKKRYWLYTLFFCWLFFIHLSGIYFFTKGFLLTRLVLEHQSSCADPPIALDDHGDCWQPAPFRRAVVLVIDALRYDFTIPSARRVPPDPAPAAATHHYLDAMPVLHEAAARDPQRHLLRPFIADPPTTTLQRLKALTTGTLPTFIDAGSNFAGTAIDEDNLVAQLRAAGRTVVHLGDDTWHALFPAHFQPNLTRAYDSFNVWDLHTVDNGVAEHLFPLLEEQPGAPKQWDVLIGHFLGLDHAGHRYGPDHPATAAKLRQMDALLRRALAALADDTLLVVLGDHGMDAKGDHGGESDDEVEAALFLAAKRPFFGRLDPAAHALPPATAKERPLAQIDLVPTLALLLGLPVPFNNLGAPIAEAFVGPDGADAARWAAATAITAAQIERYQRAYAAARGLAADAFAAPRALWARAAAAWREPGPRRDAAWHRRAAAAFAAFKAEHLRVCRALWARFDVPRMLAGVAVLAAGLLALLAFALLADGPRAQLLPRLLQGAGIGMGLGGLGVALCTRLLGVGDESLDATVLCAAVCSLASAAAALFTAARPPAPPPPPARAASAFWPALAALFTLSQAAGFAANSFTVWEDRITQFFLATFGACAAAAAQRRPARRDRALGTYHALVLAALARAAALSRLCREEQLPRCRSTYYASAAASTSAAWQLAVPGAVAVLLPVVLRGYYRATRSYEGAAPAWLGGALPLGLAGAALYAALDAADNGAWFGDRVSESTLKSVKVALAQAVLALAFAAGPALYLWAAPCVRFAATAVLPNGASSSPSPPQAAPARRPAKPTAVAVLGYANAHGTHYLLLHTALLLGSIFTQKPMGAGALALQGLQILALLELADALALPARVAAPLYATVLALLGGAHFFATGHQATLASYQWDAAFLASRTVVYPWSPLLVALNTFAGPLLAAAAVPLTVLWKRDPRRARALAPVDAAAAADQPTDVRPAATTTEGVVRREEGATIAPDVDAAADDDEVEGGGLLDGVARALAWHVLYYAVQSLATTMWAGHLRRHLMLYRVFSPRFMLGAAALLIVDLVGILVALAGTRRSVRAVAEVFGWPEKSGR